METGIFFYLDQEAQSAGLQIFRYRSPERECRYYLAFSPDGVRFFEHKFDGNHSSGCVLFLPSSLDADLQASLTVSLNLLIPNKTDSWQNCQSEEFRYTFWENADQTADSPNMLPARMLLDFLYEMQHGSLFRQSPYYSFLSERFRSHFLYNAICNKMEYQLCMRRLKSDEHDDKVTYRMAALAERRWIETIVDPRADRIFHESTWMNETVDEMNAVYASEISCMDKQPQNKRENYAGDSSQEIVSETAKIAMEWYMSKYRPDGVLRIRLGNRFMKPMCISFTAVVLLAIAGVVYCMLYPEIHGSRYFCSILVVSACLASLFALASVVPFLWNRIKERKEKRGRWSYFKYQTLPNVMMPRLFAAIAAGWMTVGLSDIVLTEHPPYEEYAGWSLVIIPFLAAFLIYSVRKILPYAKLKVCIFVSLFIIALSVIYSLVSGWFLLLIYDVKSYLFGAVERNNPQILLVFAMLSMFVGVFIQMLFRNRSVTSTEE